MKYSTVALLAALAATNANVIRMEADLSHLKNKIAEYDGWALDSTDASDDEALKLEIHMKYTTEQLEGLHDSLMAVSDPTSERYGQHLNDDDLKDLLGAPASNIESVATWLLDNGVGYDEIEINSHQDIVRVNTKVGVAENLLSTDIAPFTHEAEGVRVLRAASPYYLPAEISEVVSMVGDLMRLPNMDKSATPKPVKLEENVFDWLWSEPETWENDCNTFLCKGQVTPGVIRKRYNLSNDDAVEGNSMAVAEFQGQTYSKATLNHFKNKCGVDSTPANVIGGGKSWRSGVEAVLDIEYIKAAAPEVDLTVWYSNSYSLLNWANSLVEMKDAPLIWSVSYGNDEVQQTGIDYMNQCSVAFQKAGAKGLSLMFASGDQGACGRSGCGSIRPKKFHPDFPAANPYITAVGGTDFAKKGVIGEETSWSASGGGFSDTFDVPAWQSNAVDTYKSGAGNLPTDATFSAKGRGYPDIAALGGQVNTYCVAVNFFLFQGVAGTSASCPVAAGVFAKLNGIRLAAGKPPLGFLNPFIYQNGDAFNDVTTGNNGFPATSGWDPVTGWGTPDFEKLAEIVKNLP